MKESRYSKIEMSKSGFLNFSNSPSISKKKEKSVVKYVNLLLPFTNTFVISYYLSRFLIHTMYRGVLIYSLLQYHNMLCMLVYASILYYVDSLFLLLTLLEKSLNIVFTVVCRQKMDKTNSFTE